MSASITMKKSAVSGRVPLAGDLAYGELALNYADGLIYFKNSSNLVKSFVSGGLSVGVISGVTTGTTVSNVKSLLFDTDTGFNITDLSNGVVKISLNSTFKTWKVTGQSDLVASGEDTIQFVAGSGVSITTNPNAATKTITINATGGGSGGGSSTPSIGDTPPASPTANELWFNSTDASLYLYYNGSWVQCLAASGFPIFRQASTSITATVFGKYIVDCSTAAVTVTLPSSPTMGDEVSIIDGTGSAATNNIIIARNGNKIQGLAENMIVNVTRAAFTLVYYNSTQGWILTQI
jgi:hypothetical protein